jgi:hypothetical protein
MSGVVRLSGLSGVVIRNKGKPLADRQNALGVTATCTTGVAFRAFL